MQLFLRARDVPQESLSADEERQLAAPEFPPADKFWFWRYGRFLRDKHPEAFARWMVIYRPTLTDIVLDGTALDGDDFLTTLDDEAFRWQ
jgi:hypothetical protein